jgi:hypothetical protein
MGFTLAIIGTAGRKDDKSKLTKRSFTQMCNRALRLTQWFEQKSPQVTGLVSGGAAFADHVAVTLFLNGTVPKLTLYLPASWRKGQYHDTGEYLENPGGVANHYHRQFSEVIGIDTLAQIQSAQDAGAELIEINGFSARNTFVSTADALLAMTFGNEHEVKPGGTADTVTKYLRRIKKEGAWDYSFHYDMSSDKMYQGCRVK